MFFVYLIIGFGLFVAGYLGYAWYKVIIKPRKGLAQQDMSTFQPPADMASTNEQPILPTQSRVKEERWLGI